LFRLSARSFARNFLQTTPTRHGRTTLIKRRRAESNRRTGLCSYKNGVRSGSPEYKVPGWSTCESARIQPDSWLLRHHSVMNEAIRSLRPEMPSSAPRTVRTLLRRRYQLAETRYIFLGSTPSPIGTSARYQSVAYRHHGDTRCNAGRREQNDRVWTSLLLSALGVVTRRSRPTDQFSASDSQSAVPSTRSGYGLSIGGYRPCRNTIHARPDMGGRFPEGAEY
jgi:hypothetical protein